jgi:hypothetical protein
MSGLKKKRFCPAHRKEDMYLGDEINPAFGLVVHN